MSTGLRWAIVVLACTYLCFKLNSFNQYGTLLTYWGNMPLSRWWWLTIIFLLLPVNWWLEAEKWRILTANVEKLTLFNALRAVLAGITTGFLTPNRIGEMAGRMMFLSEGNRKAGVTLSLVNSLTQNLIMALAGLPAAACFFLQQPTIATNSTQLLFKLSIITIASFVGMYLLMPHLSALKTNKWLSQYFNCLSGFTRISLLKILAISLIRYIVFCIQFFLMLRFFGAILTPSEALMAIPTNYLFVTLFPTFAFSEAAVRSSSAVFFIGTFSSQVAGIALAGMFIWVINFVVPLLAGVTILLKKR